MNLLTLSEIQNTLAERGTNLSIDEISATFKRFNQEPTPQGWFNGIQVIMTFNRDGSARKHPVRSTQAGTRDGKPREEACPNGICTR